MTIVNSGGLFGAKVSIIYSEGFTCTVSTAKGGVFSGLEVIIIDGLPFGRKCAKILYSEIMSKRERQNYHEIISKSLEMLGDEKMDLHRAIDAVIVEGQRTGTVGDFLNYA
jgi:hypothetical protein